MKLWVDDIRENCMANEYIWVDTTNKAKNMITYFEAVGNPFELIDLDHDAGDYAADGGDYIKILDWLEKTGRRYPIRIHSANAVGVANMRRIKEMVGRQKWINSI